MTDYITLAGCGTGEYTEKKSVFLGYAAPIETEDEAIAFVRGIRKKHADARHNVYAYRVGANLTRYSDDGEPQGTAGMPVLDLLRHADITNAVLVVTRYFGGTLLGTGGLVRAYTAAGKAALADAGTKLCREMRTCVVRAPYGEYGKLADALSRFEATAAEPVFAADVTLTITMPAVCADAFAAWLFDTSLGTLLPEWMENA